MRQKYAEKLRDDGNHHELQKHEGMDEKTCNDVKTQQTKDFIFQLNKNEVGGCTSQTKGKVGR